MIKTGPLAPAGIEMEQGNGPVSERPRTTKSPVARSSSIVSRHLGGNPAGAKTKARESIERDHVDLIFGPLAAFELLAVSQLCRRQTKVPILSLAAAEDMTQRK